MLKRIFKYLFGAVIIVIAALFLGGVPLHNSFADTAQSDVKIRVYVLSNGFHSDIAIPHQNGENLAALGLTNTDYPVDLERVRYWAVGWGSITAYTSLMAVSDLTFSIAAKALAFDDAVMHITPLGALEPNERVFALDLNQAQFSALLADMKNWFTATTPMEVTQGFGDRFYQAKGHFSPWYSCNTWTGRRLRAIGIGIGAWTPISQTLEFGLKHLK